MMELGFSVIMIFSQFRNELKILAQPDCVTCGPTCLQAIYAYYQDTVDLETTISQINYLTSGGTLAVLLGNHALERGYRVTLHSVNIYLLDPSWFKTKNISLLQKLRQQVSWSADPRIIYATIAYIRFLELGGVVKFSDLSFELVKKYLKNKIPLLSGISATYFYQSMRDFTNPEGREVYDEFAGGPSGHFIILYDYDRKQNLCIADPYTLQPISRNHYYQVTYNHWLHSFLLGVITYDAEFLAIESKA